MAEVRRIPWNGLTVASTFSGCGGSSLGYRMAGFKVVVAHDFVEAARETYRANFENTPVLTEDVRQLTAAKLQTYAGLEIDVLDGSPPCASFSMNGEESKLWGKEKAYGRGGLKQRTDDLFPEYIRLIGELRPRAFVAENVFGLVRGVGKGYFKEFLAAMKDKGYRVRAAVLDAQWLGVPQIRQRLIFIGFRDDLGIEPEHPTPLPYRYSVGDAVIYQPVPKDSEYPREVWTEGYAIDSEAKRLAQGEKSAKYFNLVRAHRDLPVTTIVAGGGHAGAAAHLHPFADPPRKFTIPELRRLCGFPDDFELLGTFEQQWERLGRAVPPPMMAAVARKVAEKLAASSRP